MPKRVVKQTEAGKKSGLQPGRPAQPPPAVAQAAARSPAAVPRRNEEYAWRMARSPNGRGRGRLRMVCVAGDKDENQKDVDAAKQVDAAKAEEAADEADEESSDEEPARMLAEAAESERRAAELRAKAEKLKEEKAKKKKAAAPEKAADKVEAPERHVSPVAAAREGAATTPAVRVTASSGWASLDREEQREASKTAAKDLADLGFELLSSVGKGTDDAELRVLLALMTAANWAEGLVGLSPFAFKSVLLKNKVVARDLELMTLLRGALQGMQAREVWTSAEEVICAMAVALEPTRQAAIQRSIAHGVLGARSLDVALEELARRLNLLHVPMALIATLSHVPALLDFDLSAVMPAFRRVLDSEAVGELVSSLAALHPGTNGDGDYIYVDGIAGAGVGFDHGWRYAPHGQAAHAVASGSGVVGAALHALC